MTTNGKNRIMIFGHKDDDTYVVEFRTANDGRWRETADAGTRRQHADGYWCVADDEGVQYFWHELAATRDEYLAHSGKDDCAAA